MSAPARIVVRVDRLRIRGATPGDAHVARHELERSLARAFAQGGLSAAPGATIASLRVEARPTQPGAAGLARSAGPAIRDALTARLAGKTQR